MNYFKQYECPKLLKKFPKKYAIYVKDNDEKKLMIISESLMEKRKKLGLNDAFEMGLEIKRI